MTSKLDWAQATAAVDAAQKVLIVTHVGPDGDAIGSLLGLGNALRERGKLVTCAVDDGVPSFVEFLPGAETVVNELNSGSWDLMISVDSSDEERTGNVGAYGRAHSTQVINLDHHATNTFFGDIYLVMPEAVSATEVIYRWLVHMQQPLTLEIAMPLLTGLVTDTLGFRTSAVTADTLRIAMELMAVGASLPDITARTLDSKPYRMIELWKHALPSVALHGQVIAATISQDNLRQAGLDDVTDGGLVSFLNTVNEARVAVVFKELADGRVEISMRSKPGYDVAQVAFSVGGGGHRQAAGATIDGPLEAARQRILGLLQPVVAAGVVQ
ncbi:MAG TPA: bifunctional oligoribonuclease/PAP phosphatase NrnA [Spirillospora sp.]|nr:bifunctional oligoribonuclease/PAP phosphatase NrnA [Spirillospora sp.]